MDFIKRKQQQDAGFASRMQTILNRNNGLRSGLMDEAKRIQLISSISIAKGTLATLSLEHPSLWTKKFQTIPPEHLRILLLEVMEEICLAEMSLA